MPRIINLGILVFLLTVILFALDVHGGLQTGSNVSKINFSNIGVLANEDIKQRIIIEFNDSPISAYNNKTSKLTLSQLNTYTSKINTARNKTISALKLKNITRSWITIFNGVAVTVNQSDITKIRKTAGVKNVYLDNRVHVELQQSESFINVTQVWGKTDNNGNNLTGIGIKVAMIDTGIAYDHPDFGGCSTTSFLAGTCNKIPWGWDYVNNDPDPYDDDGHGTFTAGIVAANGSIRGVAPDAKLIAYKVLDSTGMGWDSDILTAMDNATKYGVDVISMSFGAAGEPVNPAYDVAIQNANAVGTVVVIAAGNEGASGDFSMDSPGSAHDAITVGASNKSSDISALASFSSRGFAVYPNGTIAGIKPDVLAPGISINSTSLNGSCSYYCSPTKYSTASGTSFAAPHVAGIVALLKQQHPNFTPAQLKALVVNPAVDVGYTPIEQGSGRVDALYSYQLRSIITPVNSFFALYNNVTYVWNQTNIFNITNLWNSTTTYTLALNFSQSGVNMTLSDTSLSLTSNQSVLFNLTAYINTSLISTGIYFGKILVNTSIGNTLTVPFAIFMITNPSACPLENTYINGNTILNQSSCSLFDLDQSGVFIINRSNIVLNCNNTQIFGMNYANSIGVYNYRYSNVTIQNCYIQDYYWDILSYYSNKTLIKNNIAAMNASVGVGLSIQQGRNETIDNNTILFKDGGGEGIQIIGEINSTVSNNNLNMSSLNSNYSGWGVMIDTNSTYNLITNITLRLNYNRSYDIGLYIGEVVYNNFSNISIVSGDYRSQGIMFQGNSTYNTLRNLNVLSNTPILVDADSSNFTVYDSVLTPKSRISSIAVPSNYIMELGGPDVTRYTDFGTWNFINTTTNFNNFTVYWCVNLTSAQNFACNGTVNRGWYLNANVVGNNSLLQNVQIDIKENRTNATSVINTSVSGAISTQLVKSREYRGILGNYQADYKYTLNFTKGGYVNQTTIVDPTTNIYLNIELLPVGFVYCNKVSPVYCTTISCTYNNTPCVTRPALNSKYSCNNTACVIS